MSTVTQIVRATSLIALLTLAGCGEAEVPAARRLPLQRRRRSS
jgi:hypothetical protein